MPKSSSFLSRFKKTGAAIGVGAGSILLLTGCGADTNQYTQPQGPSTDPSGEACAEYEFNEKLDVWECENDNTNHGGHYFYGGVWHKHNNVSSLTSSSSYKKYKNSTAAKSNKSTGFSSNSKGVFGG